MYIPKHFQVTDLQKLIAFIEKYSFGILFSQNNSEPFATHLPLLIKKDDNGEYYLLGHFAKSNPHWKYINDQVLVVFQGPHSYISATWYQDENTVPTWNYIAVHVYGDFILVDKTEELINIIEETIEHYESSFENPWKTDLSSDFNSQLMRAIVGFKIKINRFEGKWKLSQNHSVDRRKKLIDGLRNVKDCNSNKVADLMEQELLSTPQDG
ncbi:FMN-binding negative transcriptional regulator [Cohnella laeviribosi]|uniref:FMN-binding negative transcriptional regulator n=1 Tax=Cohnella laeviribosi TaxID=380174 RepID=UPI00037DAF66|nr:FMN-binding negative transcriptional regulator [Cohnella laeviribosi]